MSVFEGCLDLKGMGGYYRDRCEGFEGLRDLEICEGSGDM